MAYIVMGFVDIVGVSTGYVQKDFNLTDDMAQLVPAMAFLWFFLLSVPTGVLQDKYGKRRMLNIGMAVTGLGMVIPFLPYSFPVMLTAFVFLGIGNTIVQVSANPLLQDVSPRKRLSSFLSLSQFIKAIISLLGPILATFMATRFGNWRMVFAVYAVTSLLAVIWLGATRIEEFKPEGKPANMRSCFKLLGTPFILMLVLAIFLIVGADVGMNSNIQNYLMSSFGISLEEASLGISIYFTALMISRFLGAVLLNFIKPRIFLLITSLLALGGVVLMILAPSVWAGQLAIVIIGLGSGNLFPLIFAIALDRMPERANEISGLMIMAVAGGAVVPPIMGIISRNAGTTASLFVLVVCMVYVVMVGLGSRGKEKV